MNIPVFVDLTPEEQFALLGAAQIRHLPAGEVLFYEGDSPDTLYLLKAGRCQTARGEIHPEMLIDPVATLGGLPHSVKVTAAESSELYCWPMERLQQSAAFNAAARRYLARQLQQTSARLSQLTAPIHYIPNSAALFPGPFLFEDATMLFAFCEANPDSVQNCLPEGLTVLQRPGKKTGAGAAGTGGFPQRLPTASPDGKICLHGDHLFYSRPAWHNFWLLRA